MMQPMFPEGDSNVEMLSGREALVVAPLEPEEDAAVLAAALEPGVDAAVLAAALEPEVDAAVLAAPPEVDVATGAPSCCVTVTVFCEPPQPASASANATATPGIPLFTDRSLADRVACTYEHDYRSR